MVIHNLQEQSNQIQMHQQRQVNQRTPILRNLSDYGMDCPPPFFISRSEACVSQAP